MDRVYQANAIETPPSTTPSSGSYPTAGNKASGQLATVPGPYWFYSITEEIRNALIAAGITPDAAKVNQLAAAMAKFLPLSGGTMTGVIHATVGDVIKKPTDDHFLSLIGATTNEKGAQLVLSGKGRETNPGWFSLYARDGTNVSSFIGKPDGTLQWKGQNVITSAGGTFTGDVKIAHGEFIMNTVDTGWTRIFGGTALETGARIQLAGKNCSGYEGQVWIVPNNGADSPALKLFPDGTATWNGGRVLTGRDVFIANAYSATLPNGGTWAVIGHSSGEERDAGYCKTVAGGSTISMPSYSGVKFIFAIRIS